MEPPGPTFACELERTGLTDLFSNGSVIEHLRSLQASVALMLSDFSDERAEVVPKLNAAGVPVVGIPLLPLEDDYYFTADNASRVAARYDEG